MKGPEFDIEKIEAYLLNRLGPDEKVAFEQAMNQNNLLAQEVAVQQETIQAIQQWRKAELKARLDAIEVHSGAWSNTSKVAAAILLLFSLGVGTYFLIPDTSTVEENTEEAISIIADDMSVIDAATANETELIETPVPEPEPAITPLADPAKTPDSKAVSEKAAPAISQPVAKVNVPELSDNFDFGEDLDKQVSLPNPDIAKVVDTKEKLNVDLIDQEGAIRYKYYNNKLFLYGKFNAEPYEILELNANTGKELFLYFKGAFYQLNADTFDTVLLEPISDHELKQQLEQLRSK